MPGEHHIEALKKADVVFCKICGKTYSLGSRENGNIADGTYCFMDCLNCGDYLTTSDRFRNPLDNDAVIENLMEEIDEQVSS